MEQVLNYTLTVKDALIVLLIMAAIVLVIFLIVAIARVNKMLKKVDKSVEDVNFVTGVVAEKTKAVDDTVNKVTKRMTDAVDAIRSGDGFSGLIERLKTLMGTVKSFFKGGAKADAPNVTVVKTPEEAEDNK